MVPKMERLSVSVIVPSYNGANRLPRLLQALAQQTLSPDEIIVVLDGSGDASGEILMEWKGELPIIVIEQENRGRAGARNRGAELASSDLLIFYDDDMRPDSVSIESHMNVAQKNAHCLVGGQQVEEFYTNTEFGLYKEFLSRVWVQDLGKRYKVLESTDLFLSAANMSISKKVFKELGGFDSELWDAEDFDLAVRAHSLGFQVIFDPLNMGYHQSFSSLREYIERQREYRQAHRILIEKRKESSSAELYLRYQVKKSPFKQLAYFFVTGSLVSLIDRGGLIALSPKIRFGFYQRVVSALSVYYPNRSL